MDHRIGLLGGGGHCTLRRFRSGDHFIDADHEGVLEGSGLRMEKDRLGAVDIGILQVGQGAAAACGPNAFLKPSLDQAERRVVASPVAAVCNEVGLLVAHGGNKKLPACFAIWR